MSTRIGRMRASLGDATSRWPDDVAAVHRWYQPLLDEDYLTLSTIHSARGMEWQSVHVLRAGVALGRWR